MRDLAEGIAQAGATDKPIVTFMGSAREKNDSVFYQHCKALAKGLGEKAYAILTGAGSGIMEAANAGAKEAGAPSLGIRMGLLKGEHVDNDLYTSMTVTEHLLCFRRFLLTTVPTAIVAYPGGFGTLDEVMEITMLVQNGVTKKVPIVLLEDEKGFWSDLRDYARKHLLAEGRISEGDLELWDIVKIGEKSVDEIVELIDRKVKALQQSEEAGK